MTIKGLTALAAGGMLAFGTAFAAGGGSKAQDERAQEQQEAGQTEEGLGGAGEYGTTETQQRTRTETQTEIEEQEFEQTQSGQQEQEATGGAAGEGEAGQQQASLKGELVQKQRDTFFLRLDEGAVLPVKVTQQTTLNTEKLEQEMQQQGKQQQAKQEQGKHEAKGQQAMKKLQAGDKLSVELAPQEGKENRAHRIEFEETVSRSQEIQGKISSVQGNWINLDYEGALVPMRVDQQTQFQGTEERQIQSARQLQPGDEVRASFRLEEGTINTAHQIELTQAGQQGQQQQPGQQQPGQQEQQGQQQQQGQQEQQY